MESLFFFAPKDGHGSLLFLSHENGELITVGALCDVTKGMVAP